MKEKLEVGDILYRTGGISGISKIEIERVTKTLAISKNNKFRREISNGWIRAIGQHTWSREVYRLHTPELDKTYLRSAFCQIIKDMDTTEISLDSLREIVSIIKKSLKQSD